MANKKWSDNTAFGVKTAGQLTATSYLMGFDAALSPKNFKILRSQLSSLNPTDTYIGYNNAGTLDDSPLTVSGTDVYSFNSGSVILFDGPAIGTSTVWGALTFQSVFIHADGAARMALAPTSADGTTCYTCDSAIVHTSGNMAEWKNHGADLMSLNYAGVLSLWDGSSLTPVLIGAPGSGPGGSGRALYLA